jgi:hypothetical protein
VFLALCVVVAVISSRDDKNHGTTQSNLADGLLSLPSGLSVHVGDSVFDVSPKMLSYFTFYEGIDRNRETPAGDYYYEIDGHVYCVRVRFRERAANSHEEYCVAAIDDLANDAEYKLRKRHSRKEMGEASVVAPLSDAGLVTERPPVANIQQFSKRIKTQSDFEQSEFCQLYHCAADSEWPVHNNGDVNHTYHTSVSELGVDAQINSQRNPSVTGFGLTFFDRDHLSIEDFIVIAALIHSANQVTHHDKVMSFIRNNIERSVDQIKMANFIDDGDFRIWAGKVMQQTIEFERMKSDVRR